jgi:signal transduction histidine kinase
VAAERGRIAREMHDVVAHGLSVIAVQAEAAEAALRVQPQLAATAVQTVRSVARESLDEMRRVLHVLHDGDQRTAVPSLRDLDKLLTRARESGLTVDLALVGSVDGLSPACDLAAYRVVQEALTNALKHAAPAHCAVTIRREDKALCLEVTNDIIARAAPTRAIGHGLRGLQDRIEAHQGRFEAGPWGVGWRVSATIPLTVEERR